jgi:hypothetical protein
MIAQANNRLYYSRLKPKAPKTDQAHQVDTQRTEQSSHQLQQTT